MMKYYTNGTTFEIKKNKDGKYEITAYGEYVGEANTPKEAFELCDKCNGYDVPLEKLF